MNFFEREQPEDFAQPKESQITGDTITVAKLREILGILTDAQMQAAAIHTLVSDGFISRDAAAHRLNTALETLIAKLH